MNNKLNILIEKVINLLLQCGYNKKAKWFEDVLYIINDNDTTSDKFKNALLEIKSILGGMGSFSDLSMIPIEGTGMSEDEARELQWALSEELYAEIVRLLGK